MQSWYVPVLITLALSPGMTPSAPPSGDRSHQDHAFQDTTGTVRVRIAGLDSTVTTAGMLVIREDNVPDIEYEPTRHRVPFTGNLTVRLPIGSYDVEYTPPQGFVTRETSQRVVVSGSRESTLEFQLVDPNATAPEPTTPAPTVTDSSPPAPAQAVPDTAAERQAAAAVVTPPPSRPTPPPGTPTNAQRPASPAATPGYAEVLIYTGRTGDRIFLGTEFQASAPDIIIVPVGDVRLRVLGPAGGGAVCSWRAELTRNEFRCFACDPETGLVTQCPQQ